MKSVVNTRNKTKYLTPNLATVMAQRIGSTHLKITEVERNTSNPFQPEWRGRLIIEGEEKKFSTEISDIQSDETYHVVYERTETLTGEPIMEIHEIIDS
jgi:hypothetical protein